MGDVGDRPLASGTVFWESPDVWVESSLGINQPVVGQSNQVYARVSNLGWQYDSRVMVKFWWANPSLAITETTANLIGIGWCDVPSGYSVVVPCPEPWIPVLENGGHECLIAEAYMPRFDPLTSPMNPVDDRHVGQKNEQLVIVAAGETFHATVHAANVFDLPQSLTFEVHPVISQAIHPLLAARAANLAFEPRAPTAALPVSVRLSDEPSLFTGPSTLFASRLLALAQQELAGTAMETISAVQATHTAHFEPWESRKIEVSGQVPSNALAGQSFMFRVVQRIGSLVTGGYSFNVVVVDG